MNDNIDLPRDELYYQKGIEGYFEERIERLRALFTYANFLLKALFTLNGAAPIAVLAFIGHLATRDPASVNIAAEIASELWWFVMGLVLAVVTGFFAYFAAGSGFQMLPSPFYFYKRLKKPDEDLERDENMKHWRFAVLWEGLAVVCGIASLCFFVAGVLKTSNRISALAPPSVTSTESPSANNLRQRAKHQSY